MAKALKTPAVQGGAPAERGGSRSKPPAASDPVEEFRIRHPNGIPVRARRFGRSAVGVGSEIGRVLVVDGGIAGVMRTGDGTVFVEAEDLPRTMRDINNRRIPVPAGKRGRPVVLKDEIGGRTITTMPDRYAVKAAKPKAESKRDKRKKGRKEGGNHANKLSHADVLLGTPPDGVRVLYDSAAAERAAYERALLGAGYGGHNGVEQQTDNGGRPRKADRRRARKLDAQTSVHSGVLNALAEEAKQQVAAMRNGGGNS